MGLFNEHSSTTKTDSSSTQGPSGPQGIGYKLDANGNFDIENKKLTNVKQGTNNNDVVTKSQIQYIDDINPGQVKSNKAVIYSNTSSIHSNSLYLKDQYGQETIFHNEDQDDNQIRLYIPNLKNNDSFGGRLKSSIMVTSIDQTLEGKKIFHDIQVPTPVVDGNASNKAYDDNEISNAIDNLDTELNHKVNRNELRDYIKTDGTNAMTGDLNLNNKKIINVAEPYLSHDVVNKDYVTKVINHLPTMFVDRLGNSSMLGNLNMNNKRINNLQNPIQSHDAVTLSYLSDMFLDQMGFSKMLGNIDMNKKKIINVIEPVDDLDVSNNYTQIIK